MESYVIEGGRPLRGTVAISGSKNAALPLMCAALLADGRTVIENVPDLADVRAMMDVLEHLNARVELRGGRLTIDTRDFDTEWVPAEMMSRMRASMYAMGPAIARLRRAAISPPGGCNIGARPIDLHLKGFQALGVSIANRQNYIFATHKGLKGADIDLSGKFGPSVGATCNVMMAATLAEGTTIIRNAAREPEVVELARFLNEMGARIDGIGTSTLRIDGVIRLNPVSWKVMPDRIEAATFAVAALITDGDLILQNADAIAMVSTLAALRGWGAQIDAVGTTDLRIRRSAASPLPLELVTAPFPGLATDTQPLFVALLGTTPGESEIRETIYPDRFLHVDEFRKLGAELSAEAGVLRLQGVSTYHPARVKATDLRAGAALVLAALATPGKSEVTHIHHVLRGYEHFDLKLAAVGAGIRRVVEAEVVSAPPAEGVSLQAASA